MLKMADLKAYDLSNITRALAEPKAEVLPLRQHAWFHGEHINVPLFEHVFQEAIFKQSI